MSTKRIDLSLAPRSLRHGILNRSIKVKRLDRDSTTFQRLNSDNNDLSESHFVAFSHFCCTIKQDRISTFVLLGNKGQLITHVEMDTADVKQMVHLTTTQKARHHGRRSTDR